jgi:hypothetical protein
MKKTIFILITLLLVPLAFALEATTNEETYSLGDKVEITVTGCNSLSFLELYNNEGKLIFVDLGLGDYTSIYNSESTNSLGQHTLKLTCNNLIQESNFNINFPLQILASKNRINPGNKIDLLVSGCPGFSALEITNHLSEPVLFSQGISLWGTTYNSESAAEKGNYISKVTCGSNFALQEFCVGDKTLCPEEESQPITPTGAATFEVPPGQTPSCGNNDCEYYETILTCPNDCQCPPEVLDSCIIQYNAEGKPINDQDSDGLTNDYETYLEQKAIEKEATNLFSPENPDTDGDEVPDGNDFCPGTDTQDGTFTLSTGYISLNGCYSGDISHLEGSQSITGPDGCFDNTDYTKLVTSYKYWESIGLSACQTKLK